MPRTMRAETRIALLCAILGANVDPAFHVWIFRLADLLTAAVAILAAYIILLIALEGLRGIGRALPWIRRDWMEPRSA